MAKGRRGKKGGKVKRALNDGLVANKKIGKRFIKKEKTLVAPTTSSSALVVPVVSYPAHTPTPNANESRVTPRKNKERGDSERLSGFIFMCNGKTKPECYKYRVFGLPMGKMNVVENIKPGTKLFLFDFDLKLLYGVYKATSNGERNVEPSAFGGRFPAQVRFNIHKDCLPLPESEFKHAILENYQGGSKFQPELSNRQVKKLVAMFRPIGLQQAVPVAPPQSNPLPVMGDRFQAPVRLPAPEDPYAGVAHFVHAPPPTLEPRYIPPAPEPRYVPPAPEPRYIPQAHEPRYVLPALEPRYVLPAVEPRYVQQAGIPPPRSNPYYSAETYQEYLPENPVLTSQDPYSRYRVPVPEMIQPERLISRESEHHRSLLEREREREHHRSLLGRERERERGIVPHLDRVDDYYNHVPAQTVSRASALSYAPTASQTTVEIPSYQTGAYYSTMAAYEDPNRVYNDSLQRPASGRMSLAGVNVPVSSLYSFAGATPAYR